MIKPNPVAFCKEIPLLGPFFRLNRRTAPYGAKPAVDNSSLWVGNETLSGRRLYLLLFLLQLVRTLKSKRKYNMKKFMIFGLLVTTLVLVGCIKKAEAQTNSGTNNNAPAVQPQGQSPTNIELWNGFTSGMTGDEALAHARTVFGSIRENDRQIGYVVGIMSYVDFFGQFNIMSSKYTSNSNRALIIPSVLEPSIIRFYNDSDYGSINLYFLKDSLWAMNINYKNFTLADMQKALVERYGNYRQEGPLGGALWTTSGKHMILHYRNHLNIVDDRQLQGILRKIDEIAEERQSNIQL
jgi:hypothetical protein